jgi:membrane-associated protein
MEFLYQVLDFFLHLDKHLNEIINSYGALTYFILFLIIFVETGLVVMPFLPGDSLLFAAGAFAASGSLNLFLLMGILIVAAILGDTLNYSIGNFLGPKVFHREYKLLKKKHLEKTQQFYEKHGGKTIIFARFIPIIRTFAPFVAGIGKMKYSRFISFNVIGGVAWVSLFLVLGYFVGNNPYIKRNFTLVIVAIILISIIPPVIEFLKQYFNKTEKSKS